MPIPSRVEVLSWNENQVADLVREHKLLDCVDCIYQRHIDGQKLLNLVENDVLYFLEIHNENSRKKLWNIFKKINEKKGGVLGLMSKFQQPHNGRKDSEGSDVEDGEESDSFESDSDSDNYDLPEESDPNLLANPSAKVQVTVERRNTIKENLMAAMLNTCVVSPDPRDFDSSGYPEPEDIYDTPEDGCGEPDEEMYETPSDESGGGVVRRQSHASLMRKESDQYIVPNENHGEMEDELEYEELGGNNFETDEPEDYVVPDVNLASSIVPPRPPKPSLKPPALKLPPSHKSPSHKPTSPKPPSHKPSSYKPSSHKPSHKPIPPVPAQEEPEIENYEAPEPQRAKKLFEVKKPAPGKFKLPQGLKSANVELEPENYAPPLRPDKNRNFREPSIEEPQEDYEIPSMLDDKNKPDIEEPQENYEIPSVKEEAHKPVSKFLKNFVLKKQSPSLPKKPPAGTDKDKKKKKPVIEEPQQEDYEIPSVKEAKNKPAMEEPQENYEIPAVKEESPKHSSNFLKKKFESYRSKTGPPKKAPSVTEDKNKADMEEPQENYEIPSVKDESPKPPTSLGKPPPLGKRSPNVPRKPFASPKASGAPQLPQMLPRRPEAQKPGSGGSLCPDGPPNLPSRLRSPSREDVKSDQLLHPLPRKLPPRPSVTDERTSQSPANRSNGPPGLPRLPPASPRKQPRTRQLQDQVWFHGSTRKEVVTETLKNANQDGAYLVRNSSRDPGKHTMSVLYKSDIRHLDIPFENGQYRLGKSGTVKFDSIVEMVEHFTMNDVEFSAGGRTCLIHPCVKKA